MTNKRITLLNTSKSRLGSAIKRFRQATDLIDEFFKEVFPDQEKPDWNALSPEYHLLDDCRNGIHGMRQQTLRLLCQILHVKRLECRRLEPENESKGESVVPERPWQVVDESHERPGYICLAIRETESNRLVADMSDYPDDVPGFLERAREEANIIAQSREVFDMLRRMVDAVETKEEANALIDKIKNA